MPPSSRQMKEGLFQNIINKAKSEGYPRIGLYNWTEPFLNKDIAEYITMIKRAGLDCEVSTNLSLNNAFDTLENALGAGIDKLIVSVSGFDQKVYEINHRGGNVGYVKNNVEHISKLLINGSVATEVHLKFISFHYNMSELPMVREYAKSLGIHLDVFPGAGDPYQPVNTYYSEDMIQKLIDNAYETANKQCEGVCPVLMDTIAIDVSGKVFICCAQASFRSLEIGDYMEMTKDEIFLKRLTHPICITCSYPRRKPMKSDYKTLLRYKILLCYKTLVSSSKNIDRENHAIEKALNLKSRRITKFLLSKKG